MKPALDPAVTRIVGRAARRLRLDRALRMAVRAAVWMLIALVAATAAGTVVPVSAVSPWIAVMAALAAALVAAGVILLTRSDLVAAARTLDLVLHLDERASTAVELGLAARAPTALGPRVIADAAAHLHVVDLRQAIPLRFPKTTWWAPALVALLALWPALVGGLALPGTPAHRAQQVIRREGARLEQFAKTLQARARADRLPLTRRRAPQLRDLGVRLQQERVDRASALARITELSRQLESARQQIDQRLDETGRPPSSPALPSELLRRQALQRQIKQLQELTSRLRQDTSTVSKDVLDRLAAITQEGEATQPAQVRQQLQQARQQLDRGETGAAGESLSQALRMLEGMETLMADREGLESARAELEQSRTAIASGAPGPRASEQGESPPDQAQEPAGPGGREIASQPGAESAPPEGPREGSTAGTGRVDDRLGPPTPRLQAERTPQRVRGVQGEGEVSTSEVIGAGRPGTARTLPQAVSPALVARVDRALERAHIPAQYRALVRRYFERLAQLK